MPRPKRSSRAKLNIDVDKKMMLFLLNHNLCLEFDHKPHLARLVWDKWRAAIDKVWIEELPGCRCWGWWAYEAPGHRRAIAGTVSIYDRRPDILHKKYAFGIPVDYDYHPDGTPIDAEYESETDYLARLNLLTPAEKAMPLERLRLNSCDYIRRFDLDLAPVEAVLHRLGF